MQNIEIKATFPDREKGIALAKSLGASDEGSLHQVDTYFNVQRGRLKLREINDIESQLIYYERPDEDGPKTSAYEIVSVPDPVALKAVLDQSIGIWKVVEKHRLLFLYDEVRIHLDRVIGLGDFLEFEGVLNGESSTDATRAKVEYLATAFALSPADLLSGSYSDLI